MQQVWSARGAAVTKSARRGCQNRFYQPLDSGLKAPPGRRWLGVQAVHHQLRSGRRLRHAEGHSHPAQRQAGIRAIAAYGAATILDTTDIYFPDTGGCRQAGASVKGMIEPKDELPLSTFPALRERHPLPR